MQNRETPRRKDSVSVTQHALRPDLDWQTLLVTVLPKRFLLGALLMAIGVGVDLPWLNGHAVEILALRASLIGGLLVASFLSRFCHNRGLAEAIVVGGSLSSVFQMGLLGMIEGTFNSYTSAIYQVLIFVVIFLPIRTLVYALLLVGTGLIWFGVFPFLLSAAIDPRHLISDAVGFTTYGIMLMVGTVSSCNCGQRKRLKEPI